MSQAEAVPPRSPEKRTRFDRLASRTSADYLLRSLQQGLVQFSAMADAKANILIGVCALLFTLGMTQLGDPALRLPFLVLLAGAAVGLVLAILAVLPVRPQVSERSEALSAFNPLFFMHFSTVPLEQYLDAMDALLADSDRFYEAIVRDIWGQGVALGRKKYRLLRWSYTALLTGVLSALALLVVEQLL